MDVSFIIVSYNTKDLTLQAIASIEKYAKNVSHEIIVVDNNSRDGSLREIEKKFPKVILIKNKTNVGFGKANNIGFKASSGKFFFLFNSDAYFIDDSIEKLLADAKQIKNLGAVSPLILNVDKSIQQSGGFLPNLPQIFWWMTFLDDLPFGTIFNPYHIDHDNFYSDKKQMEWLTGAAFLIPKEVVEQTGGFDENIFMYGEEVEWFKRIKDANCQVYMIPDARIVHVGRGSSGKISKTAILGEYKGLIYYYQKHKSNFSLQLLRILLKMGALARILIFGSLGRKELAQTYVEAFKVA